MRWFITVTSAQPDCADSQLFAFSFWQREPSSVGNHREGLSGFSCLTLTLNSRIALCLCGLHTRKSGRCNRYLRIYTLPNLNMIFQLVLTEFVKSELLSCLPKVDIVINWCKRPICFMFSCLPKFDHVIN